MTFRNSMVWREPKNQVNDYYFLLVMTSGYNMKNKQKLTYPSLNSAVRPVSQSDEISVPIFKELPSLEDEEDTAGNIIEHGSDVYFEERDSSTRPQCFNQAELNDLVRDLSLSKSYQNC